MWPRGDKSKVPRKKEKINKYLFKQSVHLRHVLPQKGFFCHFEELLLSFKIGRSWRKIRALSIRQNSGIALYNLARLRRALQSFCCGSWGVRFYIGFGLAWLLWCLLCGRLLSSAFSTLLAGLLGATMRRFTATKPSFLPLWRIFLLGLLLVVAILGLLVLVNYLVLPPLVPLLNL